MAGIGEMPERFSLFEEENLQIFFFDVGQAESTLIVSSGKTMLIDAGSRTDGARLSAYIKKLGIEKIDYLIGTHAHEDHIGGIADVIENFDIGTFFMPFVENRKTRTYINMEETAEKNNVPIQNPEIGTTFEVGSVMSVIKHVDNSEPKNVNDSSIVIELVARKHKIPIYGRCRRGSRKLMEK
jgi:competence protein ComEC